VVSSILESFLFMYCPEVMEAVNSAGMTVAAEEAPCSVRRKIGLLSERSVVSASGYRGAGAVAAIVARHLEEALTRRCL
jgi:hypothetical protein